MSVPTVTWRHIDRPAARGRSMVPPAADLRTLAAAAVTRRTFTTPLRVHDGLDDPFPDRATVAQSVLVIGDSISEGWSASAQDLRWVSLLQERWRARYPVAGNDAPGYLPAWRNGTFAGGDEPTLVGNAIGKQNAGPGFRALAVGQAVGEIGWFPVTASGGTWTITYGGDTTAALAFDITAADLLAAMNGLPSISGGIDSMSYSEGIFDPLFPNFSRHYYPFWNIGLGDITPGTVNATLLTGGSASWATWSQGGITGTCTYEDLDADMVDVWVRYSAFTNPITVKVDGTDRATIPTASGGGDHDSNGHYVYLGPGTHDVEFGEDDIGNYPCELDGLFAYNGDGPTGGYMELHGNDWRECPDTAANSVIGDLDVRCRVRATDYTAASEQDVIAKWDSFGVDQRSWRFGITSAGLLIFGWSTTGADSLSASSTAPGFVDGTDYWMRATIDVNDGAGNRVIRFYKSSDTTYEHSAVTWTLISTTTTAGVTSIFDSTSTLSVGRISSGFPFNFTGRVYAAVALSGIGGTPIANPCYGVGQQHDPDMAGNDWISSFTTPSPRFDTGTAPFGVHVVDCAKGGATTATMAAGGTGADPAFTDIADWVTGFAPRLTVVALGVNDWATGIDPADTADNLRTIIEAIRDADPDQPVALVSWFEPHPAYHYTETADYSAYVAANDLVAGEYGGVTHLNMWVDPVGGGHETDASWRPADVPGGLIDTNAGFGLHPGDVGSEQIASWIDPLLVAYLTGRAHGTATVERTAPDRVLVTMSPLDMALQANADLADLLLFLATEAGDTIETEAADLLLAEV